MKTILASLLAHKHSITVNIGDRRLRICARCTGVVAGCMTLTVSTLFINFAFFLSLPMILQIILSAALALPAGVDWITQTWRLRESTNSIRILTGACVGVGASLLSTAAIPLIYKFLLMTTVGASIVDIGLAGRLWARRRSIPYI